MDSKSEIILYQPDNEVRLEVRLEDETVWLTQAQISELFQRDRTVITKHIANIFKEKELEEKSNVHFLHFANSDKPVKIYSLDIIISVGYRVKSQRGEAVGADIYTQSVSRQLQLDLERHNSQYPPIGIHTYRQSHDRFLIIDNSDVYHIGASLKDLGKKMFAFSKMGIPAGEILALAVRGG